MWASSCKWIIKLCNSCAIYIALVVIPFMIKYLFSMVLKKMIEQEFIEHINGKYQTSYH